MTQNTATPDRTEAALAELSRLTQDDFVARLEGIFEHSPWIAERTWSAGPFHTMDALHAAMCLVVDTAWNSGRGAVSFGTGAAGLAGVVSSSNSLVGSSAQDKVGANVVELSGSNYAVASPEWDNGAAVNAGAVTWGSGSSGRSCKCCCRCRR